MAVLLCSTALLVVNAYEAEAYSSCAKMHKVYPRGVAKDDHRVSGKPGYVWQTVGGRKKAYRPSRISDRLYVQNASRDRDKDLVACEVA